MTWRTESGLEDEQGGRPGGRWVGGRGQGPGSKALREHAKEFGLYPEAKGKLLKGFKPGKDMTRIAIWKTHSGCSVENGFEVREPGARQSG